MTLRMPKITRVPQDYSCPERGVWGGGDPLNWKQSPKWNVEIPLIENTIPLTGNNE